MTSKRIISRIRPSLTRPRSTGRSNTQWCTQCRAHCASVGRATNLCLGVSFYTNPGSSPTSVITRSLAARVAMHRCHLLQDRMLGDLEARSLPGAVRTVVAEVFGKPPRDVGLHQALLRLAKLSRHSAFNSSPPILTPISSRLTEGSVPESTCTPGPCSQFRATTGQRAGAASFTSTADWSRPRTGTIT